MGARRYGISLRVLNSIARENSNFISTSNHVLFGLSYIYILNSPLLTKKSIWLMNENKRIDNSRLKIVKSVGARAQDEKLRRNTTKTNNGRNISGKRPKSACGKSSSCQFLFSAERNAIEYVAFGFSFRVWVFFPFRESLNVTICKRYWFFSVLAAIIRRVSYKRPWIENGEGFAVHSSTWPTGAKGEYSVRSWLAISNTRDKIRYNFTCVVTVFQGWKSFFDTVVNMVKPIYFQKLESSLNYKNWGRNNSCRTCHFTTLCDFINFQGLIESDLLPVECFDTYHDNGF